MVSYERISFTIILQHFKTLGSVIIYFIVRFITRLFALIFDQTNFLTSLLFYYVTT